NTPELLTSKFVGPKMNFSHDFSYASSSDNAFIDGLYSDYKKNPESVDMSWRQFFRGVDFALSHSQDLGDSHEAAPTNLGKEFKVFNLIDAYRSRGHLISRTNPIRDRINRYPRLDLEDHGLTSSDLEESFIIGE